MTDIFLNIKNKPGAEGYFHVFAKVSILLPIKIKGGGLRLDIAKEGEIIGDCVVYWKGVGEVHSPHFGKYIFASGFIEEIILPDSVSTQNGFRLIAESMIRCKWTVLALPGPGHTQEHFENWIREQLVIDVTET